jgi:hypothetical protein
MIEQYLRHDLQPRVDRDGVEALDQGLLHLLFIGVLEPQGQQPVIGIER